jgi:hypothetical protein
MQIGNRQELDAAIAALVAECDRFAMKGLQNASAKRANAAAMRLDLPRYRPNSDVVTEVGKGYRYTRCGVILGRYP